MKYLSKRFASILLSFTFFAFALILYANFIGPAYDTIKVEQGKLIAARQRNAEYTSIFTRLKQASSEFRQSSEVQNRVSMALPLSANVPDSMNQLSVIAAANGLTIVSIDIVNAPVVPSSAGKAGESSLVKGIGVLKNSIRMTGTYEQMQSFLQGIETGVRIASISSVKVDRIANPATPGIIGITVEAETYYQLN
ncbi:hypothetical protein A2333_03115 [Candidatus Wolfebacteria bacterium RIFOXYB2_FULL_49_7]|uniref:Pilus assembly protein PilO n=1 Tax=Candidatus Wolfebacteria bacterium RIFOXYB1_FULL_54_12 TaxID=1802559 RepID=A0A1F8DXE3_9BACT|nr:MAG: hypothetical protein A2372_02315 [Candidatus Wolfebacteria bacterium RIFOXYB1_FULL_54_12]OGM94592.1 MAG: hypothetical protein A2333_03115 [Candidatus Wolfebacteria bacterium RIFOXYB2_FULL_49_7]